MRKWKFFINFEKEEQWLNELASQGYLLVNKSVRYEFQRGKPANANIKIDYRVFKRWDDFEDYRALFEDSGWRHIAGTPKSGYQYFKQMDENSSDDIFSDVDSKAARYRRKAEMWISLAAAIIPIYVALLLTDAIDAAAILNPKALYYTPGLWDKAGANFWSAFLFETPFVLFRGFLWMLPPVMAVLYFIFAARASRHYQNAKKG